MPSNYEELQDICHRLEAHYGEMQDPEFAVQGGSLNILQMRDGKRTGPAALKIAVDMVDEGLIDEERAVKVLIEPNHLSQLLHPCFDTDADYDDDILGEGLPVSPGAAVGQAVFSAEEAEQWNENGENVILVRTETSPEDVGSMDAAEGILMSRGGMTFHAAVVARGWGKPCVAGCDDIVVDHEQKSFTNGELIIEEGDWISIDGSTGDVTRGQQLLIEPELTGSFARFMSWVDEYQDIGVRTNADTADDAQQALEFGAEGIGLCRTEHMFFGDERIAKMRRMILSESDEVKREALDALRPYQWGDFEEIFRAMDGSVPARRVASDIRGQCEGQHSSLRRPERRDFRRRHAVRSEGFVRSRLAVVEKPGRRFSRQGRLGVISPEATRSLWKSGPVSVLSELLSPPKQYDLVHRIILTGILSSMNRSPRASQPWSILPDRDSPLLLVLLCGLLLGGCTTEPESPSRPNILFIMADDHTIQAFRSYGLRLSGLAPTDWRDAVYYRYWMHGNGARRPAHYGTRTKRFTLTFFYGLPLDQTANRPTQPGWALYDLAKDPHEMDNVYRDPAYANTVARLKDKLLQLKTRLGDTDDEYPALMKRRRAHW